MPNLISSPRSWKSKALLLKLEATYGVDSNPAGATDWIEARNMKLTPIDPDTVQRDVELPYEGNAGSVLVGFWAKLSFDVAMIPSGVVGTAPKWNAAMLACGTASTVTAATSVAYNLVSAAYPSVVGYLNISGVLHKLLGMRGNAKASLQAKGTPKLSFDYDALYVTPVVGAMPTVTRTGWPIEEGVNSANSGPATINGVALSWSALDWDFGQKTSRIDLPGPQKEIMLSGRTPSASVTVLAPDLPSFNPFTLAESNLVVPFSAIHGSVAGKKIKTDMQVQVTNVEYDQIEGKAAYKLTMAPAPVVGNDEIALTCL